MFEFCLSGNEESSQEAFEKYLNTGNYYAIFKNNFFSALQLAHYSKTLSMGT